MPDTAGRACCAMRWMAATMAPTLRRNWWTVRRYHWMLRMGSLPSSRRVAIRLTRLTPKRCFPKAAPSSSAGGRQLRRQRAQTRAMKTCSVTCAGTRGRSMTSRVRWVQPPDNGVPQSGQLSTACSTRWVGAIRRREKPGGRGFRDCWGAGDFGLDGGLRPGIPDGPPGLALSSNWAMRRSKRPMTACCWTMRAMSSSRLAASKSMRASMSSL